MTDGISETFGAPSLPRVRDAIDDMPDALARIGKYVLDNPEKVVRHSLSELSLLTQSGDASVVRFCHHLGYTGFRDFKIALTAELAGQRNQDTLRQNDEHDLQPLVLRLGSAVSDTARNVEGAVLTRLAKRMRQCRRVDILGAGVSGIVAQLMAYRLLRVGLPAHAFQDPTYAHEIMVGFDANCVAIAISESGLTQSSAQFLADARAAGAYTVALTSRRNSPVAQAADITLITAAANPPPIGGELVAVPAKILLIEALAKAISAL